MIEKYIDIPEYFANTDERSVQLLFCELPNYNEKLASDNSLRDLVPKKYLNGDYIVLKIIALGAGEYYGDNTNADFFPEKELKRFYKTFETNAKVYLFHKNKGWDPSYGDVLKAFYNDKMHRVELIIAIDKHKLPHNILTKLENDEPVPFSMGCRVAYDVCSICGNKARTRKEYCTHGKLELGKIYPDGRKVYRINIAPKFHDISIVRVPADKIAYPLQKIAEEQGLQATENPVRPKEINLDDLKDLSLENILKLAAYILGISPDYVEKHKDELFDEVEKAMIYLSENPDVYKQALSILGLEDSNVKIAALLDLPYKIISLLTGAMNLYFLHKLIKETSKGNNIEYRPNYGNRVVLDREASGNYFIASNTNLFNDGVYGY